MALFYSFLCLSNIPLHTHTHTHTHTHIIFFIHSSVDGHSGCFHVLAIVNSAAVNIEVHISFWIKAFVFSWYIPRSGIAGLYGSSIFSFLRTFILFSIVAAGIYIPTNNVGGFPFLCTLSSIHFCRLFDAGHSDWCEVTPHCSFDLHFFNN